MSLRFNPALFLSLIALPLLSMACSDNNENNTTGEEPDDIEVPQTYSFQSQFGESSSVSYSGQTARQVLIEELDAYIGSRLEDEVQTRETFEDKDVVLSALTYYTQFNSDEDGEAALSLSASPALKQSTFNAVSTGKNLIGKLAGNDSVTDHKDWSTEFEGWSDASIASDGGSITSPQGLLTAFLSRLAAQTAAAAAVGGSLPVNPVTQEPLAVYITPQGHDLKQLTQKLLIMAVGFSQGADDYLDSDIDGKGLKSPNTQDGENPYTKLEHAWDEGFGYFGSARDYAAYTDEEIAVAGGRDDWQKYHDTDGDGAIDLKSEYNFGASVNAAKRDLGSVTRTDYTKDAFDAFLKGRTIIVNAGEVLTAEEMASLEVQRDAALKAWEGALAATIVHYINDTLRDTIKAESGEDYDFAHHAKVWSELKGFALGMQFNPRSPLNQPLAGGSGSTFTRVHELIGDAPVVAGASASDFTQARTNLLEVRDIFKDAYGFDSANLGDDQGNNGW